MNVTLSSPAWPTCVPRQFKPAVHMRNPRIPLRANMDGASALDDLALEHAYRIGARDASVKNIMPGYPQYTLGTNGPATYAAVSATG